MSASNDGEATEPRSPAEWVTFTVAVAVILAVIAIIALQIPQSRQPPEPVAEPGLVEERGDAYVVPVLVENLGERTAENVQVTVTLTLDDGDEQEGDQVVDFLSGGEVEELEFVFDDDPGEGELDVRVSGYSLP